MKNNKKHRIRFTTTLDEEMIKRLKHIAVDENLNLNELIETAINNYLAHRGISSIDKHQE